MVWAALQTLDVGLRYVVLRELATELDSERVEPRSAQGRVRAAVLCLNHAADVLGEAPTESAYRALRSRHPELGLLPDTTVRRVLGGLSWPDCLRRAFVPAPSEGDFVKHAGGRAFTEDEVLQALRDCVHDRGGVVPTLADYLAWVMDPAVRDRPGRRPHAQSVFARFGGFRACLVQIGLSVDARQRVDRAGRIVPLNRGYSNEEMLEAVRSAAAELGRTPRTSEYRDLREAAARAARAGAPAVVPPSLTAIVERFGAWAEVVAQAGLPPMEPLPMTRAPVRRRPRYAPEQLLGWLRKAWVDVGPPLPPAAYEAWRRPRLDKARASGRVVEIPSCDAISRRFGGWRNARSLALPDNER